MNILKKIFSRIGRSKKTNSVTANSMQDVDAITHAVADRQTDFDVIENPIARAKEMLVAYEKTGEFDSEVAQELINAVEPREIVCGFLPVDGDNEDCEHDQYIGHGHSYIDKKCKLVFVDCGGYSDKFEWSAIDGSAKGNCVLCLIKHVTELDGDNALFLALLIISELDQASEELHNNANELQQAA